MRKSTKSTKILAGVIVFLLASLVFSLMLVRHTMAQIPAQEKDSDLDGISDSEDKHPFDYDNDGMPDIWEKRNGLRYDVIDAEEDSDNDGIKNLDEYKGGTNPMVADAASRAGESQEFLTPVERTMLRGMIWAGTAAFILLAIALIIYRKRILRMLRYIGGVRGEEHFEKKRGAGQPYAYTPHRKRLFLSPEQEIRVQQLRQQLRQQQIRQEEIRQQQLRQQEFRQQQIKSGSRPQEFRQQAELRRFQQPRQIQPRQIIPPRAEPQKISKENIFPKAESKQVPQQLRQQQINPQQMEEEQRAEAEEAQKMVLKETLNPAEKKEDIFERLSVMSMKRLGEKLERYK